MHDLLPALKHDEGTGDRPRLDPVGLYRRIPLLPHQMTSLVTKAEDVFVLVHLGVPKIDPARWRLSIGGLVERPMEIGFDDLNGLPQRNVQSVFQCAGNPLEPTVPTRRVANVVWTGVPLSAVMRKVSVRPEARYLWSFGLDYGEFAGQPCDAYGKDLPLSAIDPDTVLIATALNGEPLTPEHGFPARQVVPGWYGTNSVKWLSKLVFSDRRLDSLFTTTFYDDAPAGAEPRPVWDIPVESIITAPAPSAVLMAGQTHTIKGWAWAESGVASVEIGIDDAWIAATVHPRIEHAWQPFSLDWTPSLTGPCRLMARAVSHNGHIQPPAGARNAIHSVDVTIAGPKDLKTSETREKLP